MIVSRYLTKEVLWAFFAISGILLLIALSNRFAVYLAKAATGELPLTLVLRLVWLYIPELLSFVIPLSFYLGILFAFGRLYADSEMIVLSASGFGWRYLSRITLMIAVFAMIIVAFLTFWLVPKIAGYRDKAMNQGEALAVVQSVLPGRFQSLEDGRLVFYLEDMDTKDKTLKGIFIAEQPKATPTGNKKGWALITAKEANVDQSPDKKDFYLVLRDGYRYQGTPGSADYTVVKFKEYGRAVKEESNTVMNAGFKLKSSKELLKSTELEDIAELQWRLSIPLSVPILALLALPLASVQPRQGRYAKFLPAILIYIVYFNLFTLSKRWIIAGILPTYIGMIWVHILFLLLALSLIAIKSGWLLQFRTNWKNRNKTKLIQP